MGWGAADTLGRLLGKLDVDRRRLDYAAGFNVMSINTEECQQGRSWADQKLENQKTLCSGSTHTGPFQRAIIGTGFTYF